MSFNMQQLLRRLISSPKPDARDGLPAIRRVGGAHQTTPSLPTSPG